MQSFIRTLVSLFVLAGSTSAFAQSTPVDVESASEPSVRFDIEVDPIVYALQGYSLHVGIASGDYRVDVGAFGLTMPEFAHGNEGFDVAFGGFGLKLDRTFGEDGMGFLVGIEGGLVRQTVALADDNLAQTDWVGTVGLRTGYRIPLGEHFFVLPWIGVGYAFGPDEVTLGGETYEANPVTIFPTVHLGYRI